MACELFRGKKKKQKKNTHTPIFTNIGKIKNRNSHKNRSPISAFGFYFSLVSLGEMDPFGTAFAAPFGG